MSDGKIDASQAVDLDPNKRDALLRDAKAAEEQQKREEAIAFTWRRAMRRAFKGKYSHRSRMRNLARFWERARTEGMD